MADRVKAREKLIFGPGPHARYADMIQVLCVSVEIDDTNFTISIDTHAQKRRFGKHAESE